jgi:hypothetical protein
MNTEQSLKTNQLKPQQKPVNLKAMCNTVSHFLLAFVSQLVELIFPGMLSGQILTPELLAELIKTILHSTNN